MHKAAINERFATIEQCLALCKVWKSRKSANVSHQRACIYARHILNVDIATTDAKAFALRFFFSNSFPVFHLCSNNKPCRQWQFKHEMRMGVWKRQGERQREGKNVHGMHRNIAGIVFNWFIIILCEIFGLLWHCGNNENWNYEQVQLHRPPWPWNAYRFTLGKCNVFLTTIFLDVSNIIFISWFPSLLSYSTSL